MPHRRVVDEPDDLLDELLAVVVGRMRLPGDDHLDRPPFVEQQRTETLLVAQHQREPLVRRDTAGEADGQHVGIENPVDPAELQRRRTALQPRRAQASPDFGDELFAQLAPQRPEVRVAHALTQRAAAVAVETPFLVVAPEQRAQLASHPRRPVDAVGHRGDRHLVLVESRPQPGEHATRDAAVQPGHAVRALRQPQPHVRHVEQPRVVLGAEREDAPRIDVGHQPAVGEVALHQVDREAVDARADRGVRGEHGPRADRGQRLLEGEAVGLDDLARAFQAEKARMPFVRVEHQRLRVPGQLAVLPDGAEAADAGDDLLPQPVIGVASVEPVGDAAQVVVVRFGVGVEQQQGNAADARLPDLRAQLAPARHRDADEHRPPARGQQLQGERVRVDHRIVLDLPAVQRKRLAEVAVAVQQADADHRHAEVGRRLEVITGEHAEAARVVRQRLGDPELHREVRDGRGQLRVVLPLVPARLGQVTLEVGGRFLGVGQEIVVDGQFRQPGRGQRGEHPQRVADGVEQLRVHRREQVARGRMPGPAEVGGQLAKTCQ